MAAVVKNRNTDQREKVQINPYTYGKPIFDKTQQQEYLFQQSGNTQIQKGEFRPYLILSHTKINLKWEHLSGLVRGWDS